MTSDAYREGFARGHELGRRQGREDLLRELRALLGVPSVDDLDRRNDE